MSIWGNLEGTFKSVFSIGKPAGTHYIEKSGDDLRFKDPNNSAVRTLTELYDEAGLAAQERSGFPNRTDSTISRTDSGPDRTFTIQPAVSSYDFYVLNVKYTKSGALTKVWTDTEGLHFFYFDDSGTLQTTTTFSADLVEKYAIVAILYWDAANSESILLGDERHGLTMSGRTHRYLHSTVGATWGSGLLITLSAAADSSGDNATSAQFKVGDGTVWDEDLLLSITDGSPQDLDPTAQVPIAYRDGASGDWRLEAADNFPLLYNGKPSGYSGTRVPYNQWTGSTWQLTEVGNNDYVLMHFFATNDVDAPFWGIPGQATYSTIGAARAGAETELGDLLLSGLPSPEMVPIATVIFQTATGYANTPKARIRSTDGGNDYVDWRGKGPLAGVPGSVDVHGSTHLPSGSDALTTAAPSQGIGGGNSAGSAESFARSDHDHKLRTTTGPADLTIGAIADGQVLTRSGSAIVGAAPGSGSDSNAWSVAKATHGFVVTNVLYMTTPGGVYTKAKADNAGTLGLFVVSAVADAGNFTARQSGLFTATSHGLTVGEFYYASDATAGAITLTPPTAVGSYTNPLIFVLDANTLLAVPYRPADVPPVAAYKPDYIKGLHISNNSGTPDEIIDIEAGRILADGGSYDMYNASVKEIDITASGENGLDTSTVDPSLWYAVWLIEKADGTEGGLFSLSYTSPTMPSGYIHKRLIGEVRTDTTSDIQAFIQIGEGFERTYYWNFWDNSLLQIEGSGDDTPVNSWYDCTSLNAGEDVFGPTAIAMIAQVQAQRTDADDTFNVTVRPIDSLFDDNFRVYSTLEGAGNNTQQAANLHLPVVSDRKVQYLRTAATGTARVIGLGWVGKI